MTIHELKIRPKDVPVDEVVKQLEEALADARTGRVRAIGIAYVLEDERGDPQPWVKTAFHWESGRFYPIFAAVRRLGLRLERVLAEDGIDEEGEVC